MFYGLSKKQMKELAYKFAMELEKNVPNIWTINEAAGEDWLKGFKRRHSSITLRKPEATSRARASAFNQYNVGEFFNNRIEASLKVEGKSGVERQLLVLRQEFNIK